MKNLYILVSCCLSILLHSQNPSAPEIYFRTPVSMLTDSRVRDIAIQADGKIVMVGSFLYSDNSAKGIIRLNANGTRDTGFNTGTGIDNWGAYPSRVRIQSDGKIIVVGDFTTYNGLPAKNILRLNSDGTRDTAFNMGTGLNSQANALALQTDGKILVGGQFTTYNGIAVTNFVRLNLNGTIDSSFNMGTGFGGFSSSVSTIELQNDGKILVCGGFSTYNDINVSRMIRLNNGGTRDMTLNYISFDQVPDDIKVQPNGKILIAGGFTSVNGNSNVRALARLNANGSVDSSFPTSTFYSGSSISSIALKPNGKIVVGGGFSSQSSYNITVLNNDGTQDISFYANPGLSGSIGGGLYVVKVQPDGKILMGGYFDEYNNNYSLGTYGRLLGTEYYTLRGNARIDYDNNGCDASDIRYPFLQFQVVNGATTSTFFSNSSGGHESLLKNGSNVITPIMDNPSYFSVSPPSVTINYPAAVTPYYQDFCFTPTGNHPDLNITLLPVNAGRPGFDAIYKLLYRNKGNQIASGMVTMSYNDAATDFVSANPAVSSQSFGSLSWNYTNLLPFETREILVKLNLNSQSETPSLNSGDVLSFTGSVSLAQTDEMPEDNTGILNQTLVNAQDPNDKICLQGGTIAPEMTGEYVDYIIRFENLGTYMAQNVSVKDVIDQSKFDISSLRPTNASHSFVTRIFNSNNVEFYFENINLPFDDANNDGYISFKIRTLPTLTTGNSFSNTASIFFDYNQPIITNTATTVVQTLGKKDFVAAQYVTLHPNPTYSRLGITTSDGVELERVEIYNMLGQLMRVIANSGGMESVDVSGLASGQYALRMVFESKVLNGRFIKK